MRKIAICAVILALSITHANADPQKEPLWIPEAPGHPYYSTAYRLRSVTREHLGIKNIVCFVDVHADGKGVTLLVRGERLTDGGYLLQQVDIRKDAEKSDRRYWGDVTTIQDPENDAVFPPLTRHHGGYREAEGNVPDLFAKLTKEAGELPPNVRTLFFGEYGLGKLPKRSAKTSGDTTSKKTPR